MSNLNPNQSIYAPLPQNLSDSDSEEEYRRPSLAKQDGLAGKKVEEAQRNGLDHPKYYSTDEDSHGQPTRAVDSGDDVFSGDNVALLRKDMSLLRKTMFVFSILFCFLTVGFFLWVLPCNDTHTCASKTKASKQTAWEIPYHDIEFKGPINVVNSAVGNGKSIVLLYRGNILKPDWRSSNRINSPESSNNGIMLIVGDTGKVGWFIPQQRLPADIDCSLLDVNQDGINDCLVVGSDGLFAVLNPFSGTMIWYVHNHGENNLLTSVDFPLLIFDVDSDGVPDLMTSCGWSDQNHNSVIIISGRTGNLIGRPLQIRECTSIHKLQVDRYETVSFTCKNNTSSSESLKVYTLQRISQQIVNGSVHMKPEWVVPPQHAVFGQRREIDNQRNIYTIANKKLIIENRGQYPKYSKVMVQLFSVKNGKDNMIWDYHANRVYGMVPAIINFDRYVDESKHITGFVLKFWQWIGVKSSSIKEMNDESSHNGFTQPMLFENNSTDGKNNARNISSKAEQKDGLSYHRLSERVVLVTFNETDFHIVNATQSDVIQVCRYVNWVSTCQPDMRYQENSLLITDIDNDGSQELISYLTTFKGPTGDSTNVDILNKAGKHLKLTSTLRIIHLESELPKLYEAVSHR